MHCVASIIPACIAKAQDMGESRGLVSYGGLIFCLTFLSQEKERGGTLSISSKSKISPQIERAGRSYPANDIPPFQWESSVRSSQGK